MVSTWGERAHPLATWSPREGWSKDLRTVPARPGSTVALAFSDPTVDTSEALQQLRAQVPATVIGCSTAGQILGPRVDPAPLVVAITAFDTARVVGACTPRTGARQRMWVRLSAGS